MPWLGSFFYSTTQQPTTEKNYPKKNKKKNFFTNFGVHCNFHNFGVHCFFWGGEPPPPPPMGGFVWCTKILQFLNFSRWRWLLLRIHHIGASFEQVFFFPQLTSTETNFNEKTKKNSLKAKKKKKKKTPPKKKKKKKKNLCQTHLGFGDENTLDYSDVIKRKLGTPK